LKRGGDWLNDRGSGMLEVVGRLKPAFGERQGPGIIEYPGRQPWPGIPLNKTKIRRLFWSSPGLITAGF